MIKFLHHLLTPHCKECAEDLITKAELNSCKSCETLKLQLEIANREKRDLLDRILLVPEEKESEIPQPIMRSKQIPWEVLKRNLEEKSRLQAQEMRVQQELAQKLEEADRELKDAPG